MTTEPEQLSGGRPAPDRRPGASERRGYARLARRISATTTNCLLTAVVLVAGLGFGRQVLRWWAADAADSADSTDASRPARPFGGTSKMPRRWDADGLGDPRRLHVLQFGEKPWSLRRQSIAGGKQAAATALRAVCREVVRQDRLPDQPPGEAEDNFLSRLATRDPAEQEPAKWRLYELDGAFPMVVGTQPRTPSTAPPQGGNLATTAHRVVVWGLALPVGPEAWTLFAFQPEVPGGRQPAAPPELPVPPECRRTLSLQVAGGGATLAFDGPQVPRIWADFYDQWFATHNWRRAEDWRQSGSRWHARYTAPDQDPAHPLGRTSNTSRRWEVDVHFGSGGPGRGTGLVMMNPSASGKGPE